MWFYVYSIIHLQVLILDFQRQIIYQKGSILRYRQKIRSAI